jgi:hypothetical protein
VNSERVDARAIDHGQHIARSRAAAFPCSGKGISHRLLAVLVSAYACACDARARDRADAARLTSRVRELPEVVLSRLRELAQQGDLAGGEAAGFGVHDAERSDAVPIR